MSGKWMSSVVRHADVAFIMYGCNELSGGHQLERRTSSNNTQIKPVALVRNSRHMGRGLKEFLFSLFMWSAV